MLEEGRFILVLAVKICSYDRKHAAITRCGPPSQNTEKVTINILLFVSKIVTRDKDNFYNVFLLQEVIMTRVRC